MSKGPLIRNINIRSATILITVPALPMHDINADNDIAFRNDRLKGL
jgi:hypothetical protein